LEPTFFAKGAEVGGVRERALGSPTHPLAHRGAMRGKTGRGSGAPPLVPRPRCPRTGSSESPAAGRWNAMSGARRESRAEVVRAPDPGLRGPRPPPPRYVATRTASHSLLRCHVCSGRPFSLRLRGAIIKAAAQGSAQGSTKRCAQACALCPSDSDARARDGRQSQSQSNTQRENNK
jgi:hypothetical protein